MGATRSDDNHICTAGLAVGLWVIEFYRRINLFLCCVIQKKGKNAYLKTLKLDSFVKAFMKKSKC